MTAVTLETLRILCRALGVDALPAGDVATVDRWTELPGFTVDRFRKIILATQQRGTRVSSVRYWERAVLETFRPLAPPPLCRGLKRRSDGAGPVVSLLSERPWQDYLSYYLAHYGPLDAPAVLDLWFRYNSERQILGLPTEEKWYEVADPLSRLPGGAADADPLPRAA